MPTVKRGRGWLSALRAIGAARVAWTIALAVAVAALLNPIFEPSFIELLARTLFVALVSLLAFSAAGHWRRPPLPRWLVQVLALALAAPLATLAVYLLVAGGDMPAR